MPIPWSPPRCVSSWRTCGSAPIVLTRPPPMARRDSRRLSRACSRSIWPKSLEPRRLRSNRPTRRWMHTASSSPPRARKAIWESSSITWRWVRANLGGPTTPSTRYARPSLSSRAHAAGVIRYLFWNFKGARADFDAYLTEFPDGDQAVEARYYRALSSLARDTTTQLLQLASDVPDDDFAPMALLEAGKAQEELGNYASAAGIYDGLVATYPTRDAGMAGAFRRGLDHFMLGDSDGALSTWNAVLGRDPEPAVRAQALYWSGKVLDARGDSSSAREKYQSAAAVRPVDYYVMRAQVALGPPPSSADVDPAASQPSDEADLAHWFAGNGLDLTAGSQVASQDPAFIRATALVQHGLFKQANWEYEIFLTTYADKPDRLYWLAARFGEMGLSNAELKLGTAALDGATAGGQVSVLDVPPALARVASPLAFPDLVASAATQRGLDPLLFMSLMQGERPHPDHPPDG
ncbi:MAG: tetratricopeptide repeat protein [Chloroflexi bacterium]|nr:MAG: tetratricopeptide repeat protein [Chloroflexota bacterium]